MAIDLRTRIALLLAAGSLACPALAIPQTDTSAPTIQEALSAADEQVRAYDQHVTTLAGPFMEGRLPGTHGMDVARDYVEFYLKLAGLQPPFETEQGTGYRQRFPLGNTVTITDQDLALPGHPDVTFVPNEDYTATAMGADGDVNADLVFVGYSITDGPDGWSSFERNLDLTGKIAVMLRFEPVNEDGNSAWNTGRGWSPRAGFVGKLGAIRDAHPAAVIIINTPGTNDDRANSLLDPTTNAGTSLDVPVFHMTTGAGERLIAAATNHTHTLAELRDKANEGGHAIPLDASMSARAAIDTTPLIAQNVAGLLPGKGDLADELIVMGAHLDHLGMGNFGSRAGPRAGRALHPGADDNASGSSAVIMLAQQLAQDYADLDNARSILFICFDAEESGLNGSRYYVDNPIRPWDEHALMINFDMIGRIVDEKLAVFGTDTADGMRDWLEPIFEASPLQIVTNATLAGGSDHLPFLQKELPTLFAICTPLHADYHTPDDVSWKINRVSAVETINLFHQILLAAATRPEDFVWSSGSQSVVGGPRMGDIKVKFGISSGNYDDKDPGVLVSAVTEDGSAGKAGVKPGDRLLTWNGETIEGIMPWMTMLSKHKPGDRVDVGLRRDGEVVHLEVTLQAP